MWQLLGKLYWSDIDDVNGGGKPAVTPHPVFLVSGFLRSVSISQLMGVIDSLYLVGGRVGAVVRLWRGQSRHQRGGVRAEVALVLSPSGVHYATSNST